MIITKHRKLKKLEDEQWREIPDSDGRYFISNYGRVKSYVYNKIEGKIVKPFECKGLKVVALFINMTRKYYIHKLAAEIWQPKPSDEHIFVIHIDGNIKNNHISNLQWVTKETFLEKKREVNKQKLLRNKFLKRNHSKLKATDVILLKSMLQRGVSQVNIAKLFSISEMQVYRIKTGENWSHIQL